MLKFFFAGLISCLMIFGIYQCSNKILNNPYPDNQSRQNILYGSFSERPKTLDPVKAYNSDEYQLINQIYEAPLQYHYLKRPYTLIPLTATKLPKLEFFDTKGQPITSPTNPHDVAYSLYTISIKPGIYYQPHPALAKDNQGNYLYHNLDRKFMAAADITNLKSFKYTGTRELIADDYIYQIKRLADPKNQSPIYGLMSDYIIGLKQLNHKLADEYHNQSIRGKAGKFIDLRNYPILGVIRIDRYTFQIKIKGMYPQFNYWLAMPFFVPMPWEADKFYSQPGLLIHNITLDWFPIGTGAYMLTKNNPNRVMVLEKNPNFHTEFYPTEGMPADQAVGLLDDTNKRLPFIDKIIFTLEKEFIPRWNKFLQGYYDSSGITSDSFEQAINITGTGEARLTSEMRERGIYLRSSVIPAIHYTAFNMLDRVVGGNSEQARKLRLAIAIALDTEEYISIFLNGSGVAAHGPIPPGIMGGKIDEDTYNHDVYSWQQGKPIKKSLAIARQLLAEAGYPNGRSIKTGEPLILNYDIPISNGPDAKANSDWMRKQFAKLGIQLNINETQYNRFQEKLRLGDSQLFSFGWYADYPDPENFLFLFYGPNGEVKFDGPNSSNYDNKEFNKLFEKIQSMPDSPQRLQIINQMLKILQHDSPWVWGFFPKSYALYHQWVMRGKIVVIGDNTLKYRRVEPQLRDQLRKEWNKPVIWPLVLMGLLVAFGIIPIYRSYKKREFQPPIKLK